MIFSILNSQFGEGLRGCDIFPLHIEFFLKFSEVQESHEIRHKERVLMHMWVIYMVPFVMDSLNIQDAQVKCQTRNSLI